MSTPFWFVWNPDGNAPRFPHPNEDSAKTEAKRLARANPGESFIVLESVCEYVVNDLQETNLRPVRDEIPF